MYAMTYSHVYIYIDEGVAQKMMALEAKITAQDAKMVKGPCNTLQHSATHCNKLQQAATHCQTLQHIARDARILTGLHSICWAEEVGVEGLHCNILQYTATHRYALPKMTNCNTLQHNATHCNTMQHT